jgi:hypothetical protein
VKDGIRAYVETVIGEEWPLLAKGRLSDRAWGAPRGRENSKRLDTMR